MNEANAPAPAAAPAAAPSPAASLTNSAAGVVATSASIATATPVAAISSIASETIFGLPLWLVVALGPRGSVGFLRWDRFAFGILNRAVGSRKVVRAPGREAKARL